MMVVTSWSLVLRNLRYFRAANLAVVAGAGVGAAVRGGGLVVGDRVRGSLRGLAVVRLGPVDQVMVGGMFVGEDLVQRIAGVQGFGEKFERIEGGIVLR